MLQLDWSILRFRPSGVSVGTTATQFDCTEQSPQPSQTRVLMKKRGGRIDQLAFLAPAALLGRAGLLVDEHGHALHLAQPPLHRIELGARMELGAFRKAVVDGVVLGDVVGEHDHLRRAFGFDLAGDAVDRDDAVDRLAAGHRDRVVEEHLVGDVGLGRDRLADRQVAGVVVGAVAEVLEDVRHLRELRVRDPVDAFAAHLDQARGVAVHPRGHEVAADAGLGREPSGTFVEVLCGQPAQKYGRRFTASPAFESSAAP